VSHWHSLSAGWVLPPFSVLFGHDCTIWIWGFIFPSKRVYQFMLGLQPLASDLVQDMRGSPSRNCRSHPDGSSNTHAGQALKFAEFMCAGFQFHRSSPHHTSLAKAIHYVSHNHGLYPVQQHPSSDSPRFSNLSLQLKKAL
jgi:hypothetical protein